MSNNVIHFQFLNNLVSGYVTIGWPDEVSVIIRTDEVKVWKPGACVNMQHAVHNLITTK